MELCLPKNEIFCPKCNKNIQDNKSNIDLEHLEFETEFSCECGLRFIIIICVHCQKNIFFKKEKNINLNGVNIKCPYNSCGKYFYLTKCPKCKSKKFNKIPKLIKEGEIIKCNSDNDCGFEYLQLKCPVKGCEDIKYYIKPKNFKNNPNGMLYTHKSEIILQKITCHFCNRPIVFRSNKEKINRYYEAQKIICPYEDCKKVFNRIICDICSQVNIIEGGYYFMGHKIRCIACRNYFGKILCPLCLKINPLQNSFFKTGVMICRYSSCSKKFNIVNCLHCQRINIFNADKPPIPGQQIKCAYSDCDKTFNEVYCPSCNELNPFPDGDFIFGKVYECIFKNCKKKFQFCVCPKCLIYSRVIDSHEGKKYSCNKCKKLLSNWGCPFCHKTIMDKDSNLKYGQMVKCPNPHCNKKYSFCRCYKCKKLIFSEEDKKVLGISIECKECKSKSVNIICPNQKCKVKISLLDREEDMNIGEKIKCPDCKNEFEYKEDENNDIYSENLSNFGDIKGEAMNFGQSEIDFNYIKIENNIIESDLYKDHPEEKVENNDIEIINNSQENKNKKNSFCILCHNHTKKSIFYPCGHRCVCYNCGLYYLKMFHKCPRCLEDAETIIPKIYETFNDTEKGKDS